MISAYPVVDPLDGTSPDSIDPAPHPGSGPQPPELVPLKPPHLSKHPSPLGPGPVGPIDPWLPGPRGPVDHGPPIIPLPPIVPVLPWKPIIPGTFIIGPAPGNPLSPRESDS